MCRRGDTTLYSCANAKSRNVLGFFGPRVFGPHGAVFQVISESSAKRDGPASRTEEVKNWPRL